MMKNYIILFLLFAFASCSSFDRMKYRHLKKVPATPQVFSVAEEMIISVPEADTARSEQNNITAPVILRDTDVCARSAAIEFSVHDAGVRPEFDRVFPEKKSPKRAAEPIKRDWSLFIGLLLILCGMLMLSLCIFYFPSAGISFLWMIAFELASLYAAWRMIGTGVTYFISRFRSKRNFSER